MNRNALKSYAPQARREFIQAITDRAAFYGLTATKNEPMVERGDVAVIGGRSFPIAVARKRKALEGRINRHGFEQTMEAMAYTWFNRLVAIRYMELHGYLDHGYRVLSVASSQSSVATDKSQLTTDNQQLTTDNQQLTTDNQQLTTDNQQLTPDIVRFAEHVDLPGLKRETVIDLKLAGNRESELYRLLLTAQCNALHTAMPFLFEKIDDETELLLPDNLLNSDSLIRKLVNEIDEEDWREVEIIGWLYQFYISAKQDAVSGKVVASEDIPAATQLFTPNWIVKYLVQNTIGRIWLEHHPDSPLKAKMEYYIEPAEQTPEVQAQLQQIIEARTRAHHGFPADCHLPSADYSLNPEALTLLDPACGSGHILVEAYDLFKAIYQERGYRARDIPALILQKNLFGMEIDDRAAQLAAFAVMMKARADDRRIFDSEARPNVVSLQQADCSQQNLDQITDALDVAPGSDLHTAICDLHSLFENARTFGSLIQVPPRLAEKIPEIERRLDAVLQSGSLKHASVAVLKPLLRQARLLCRQYSSVVANPPYMGHRTQNSAIKSFLASEYSIAKTDLFSAFVIRNFVFAVTNGYVGFMTPFVWMFIFSYAKLRSFLLDHKSLATLIQLEYSGFDGATVPICTFTFLNQHQPAFLGSFIRLSSFSGAENQGPRTLEAIRNPDCGWLHLCPNSDFKNIPRCPIAYWVSSRVRACFGQDVFARHAISEGTVKTANNARFIRNIWEVRSKDVGPAEHWRLHPKGGEYRRWYGNLEHVVDWSESARNHYRTDPTARIPTEEVCNLEGITWTAICSNEQSFRMKSGAEVTNHAALFLHPRNPEMLVPLLCCLNSSTTTHFLKIISPTVNNTVGDILSIPFPSQTGWESIADRIGRQLIAIAKEDWDSSETSSGFQTLPLLFLKSHRIQDSLEAANAVLRGRLTRMQELEEENNRLFIEAYGLQDEISPAVSDHQITLRRPDQEEDIRRLLSYSLGCMLGRYSLDNPGLIYAHSGNHGFDPSLYDSYSADTDGFIPLTETDWGHDDATNRFVEFIGAAWPREHLEENLKFVADSLRPTGSEQPRETIRRYLSTGFYKHHLLMYRKRPIYWLFSSGKQRAFQCLVYLHRYHEGTLARMRTEYVIPLQGQIAARIEQLEGDKAKATSTSHRRKLQKEQDDLRKQQTELLTFEEKLKHAADQKISLDLDDGVKVNYAKFGDLLAESRAICGTKDDD